MKPLHAFFDGIPLVLTLFVKVDTMMLELNEGWKK